MSATEACLLVQRPAPHLALVLFNRPEARNAVNSAVAAALGAAAAGIDADDDIRVAILASSTPGMFCAGADLREAQARGTTEMIHRQFGFAGFVKAPRTKPWIAAVTGAAVGGGFEIVLACDLIVAGQSARFGLPEVKRGLLAGGGGVMRLPRMLPQSVANEMILTGAPISAQRAHHFGMVNYLEEDAQVLDRALALAQAVAANAPLAVRGSLQLARVAQQFPEEELRRRQREIAPAVRASADAKEGRRAFLEKRLPRWQGR